MTEYEWLPPPAFLTKVKVLPLIPKKEDVKTWLKRMKKARKKEIDPDKKYQLGLIVEEFKSIKEML